jgi:hypothetical protein
MLPDVEVDHDTIAISTAFSNSRAEFICFEFVPVVLSVLYPSPTECNESPNSHIDGESREAKSRRQCHPGTSFHYAVKFALASAMPKFVMTELMTQDCNQRCVGFSHKLIIGHDQGTIRECAYTSV